MELVRKYFKQGLLLSIVLGAVFAFLGVYNTNAHPYFNRFVFWTATMVVGSFSTGLAVPWIFKRLLPNQHRIIQLLAVAIVISFPVTLVLAAFDHNYGLDWSAYIWLMQYRYVIVISAILIFSSYFVLKAQGVIDSQTPNDVPAQDQAAQFLQRLPKAFHQAELYAVSSEDHYLRVITSEGETLILMRLSDALRELEPIQGMQTHRSWWVAESAVVNSQRSKGKLTLELKSGESVPVSRSFDKAVRESLVI